MPQPANSLDHGAGFGTDVTGEQQQVRCMSGATVPVGAGRNELGHPWPNAHRQQASVSHTEAPGSCRATSAASHTWTVQYVPRRNLEEEGDEGDLYEDGRIARCLKWPN